MELMRVWHVMHKEQEIVRAVLDGFIQAGDGPRILSEKTGACRGRPIEAHAVPVGLVPLSPAISLGSFNRDAKMISTDVGQRLQAKRTGVVLVGSPRTELQVDDGFHHGRIISKREAC